jgi:hypothetical protein
VSKNKKSHKKTICDTFLFQGGLEERSQKLPVTLSFYVNFVVWVVVFQTGSSIYLRLPSNSWFSTSVT